MENGWILDWLRVSLRAAQCERIGLRIIRITEIVCHIFVSGEACVRVQVVDLVEGFLCLVRTVGCHTGVDGSL